MLPAKPPVQGAPDWQTTISPGGTTPCSPTITRTRPRPATTPPRQGAPPAAAAVPGPCLGTRRPGSSREQGSTTRAPPVRGACRPIKRHDTNIAWHPLPRQGSFLDTAETNCQRRSRTVPTPTVRTSKPAESEARKTRERLKSILFRPWDGSCLLPSLAASANECLAAGKQGCDRRG